MNSTLRAERRRITHYMCPSGFASEEVFHVYPDDTWAQKTDAGGNESALPWDRDREESLGKERK